MNNQYQYHVKEKIKQLKDYQSYTAYPGNGGFKLHSQSTRGCVRLELSNIFKKTSPQLSPSEQQ